MRVHYASLAPRERRIDRSPHNRCVQIWSDLGLGGLAWPKRREGDNQSPALFLRAWSMWSWGLTRSRVLGRKGDGGHSHSQLASIPLMSYMYVGGQHCLLIHEISISSLEDYIET